MPTQPMLARIEIETEAAPVERRATLVVVGALMLVAAAIAAWALAVWR